MNAVRMLRRLLRLDTRGATAIEYGLIAALIAVACVSAMKNLGGGANGMWGKLDNEIKNASN